MTAPAHFNLTARVLHWCMAVMILAMLFVGVGMVASISERPWLVDLHRPLGIVILLLAVARLVYRLRNPPPPLPADLPRWQALRRHRFALAAVRADVRHAADRLVHAVRRRIPDRAL